MATDADGVTALLREFTADSITRLTLEVTANLVEDTPVDTGWARANWVPNIGTAVQETTGSKEAVDRTAQSQGIAEVVALYRLPQLIYVSNPTPYITDLNDGSSTQAPAGFVQISIQRAIAEVT